MFTFTNLYPLFASADETPSFRLALKGNLRISNLRFDTNVLAASCHDNMHAQDLANYYLKQSSTLLLLYWIALCFGKSCTVLHCHIPVDPPTSCDLMVDSRFPSRITP